MINELLEFTRGSSREVAPEPTNYREFVEEFIKQAQDGDVTTSANELFSSHPLLAKRILALADFAQSPLVMGLNRPATSAVA